MKQMDPFLKSPVKPPGLWGFDFVDLYPIYYRKIFQHELARNMKVEEERLSWSSTKHARANKLPLCSYHNEFSQMYHDLVHKSVETEYSRSKWPKSCDHYESKKLKALFSTGRVF